MVQYLRFRILKFPSLFRLGAMLTYQTSIDVESTWLWFGPPPRQNPKDWGWLDLGTCEKAGKNLELEKKMGFTQIFDFPVMKWSKWGDDMPYMDGLDVSNILISTQTGNCYPNGPVLNHQERTANVGQVLSKSVWTLCTGANTLKKCFWVCSMGISGS